MFDRFPGPQSPVSSDEKVLPLDLRGRLSKGSFISCFQGKKGSSECPSCTYFFFYKSLLRNNQYGYGASLGVTYSGLLQGFLAIELGFLVTRMRSLREHSSSGAFMISHFSVCVLDLCKSSLLKDFYFPPPHGHSVDTAPMNEKQPFPHCVKAWGANVIKNKISSQPRTPLHKRGKERKQSYH